MPFKRFAYGSNMFTLKMQRAVRSAQATGRGFISGYVLRCNKVSSKDGSGKGNLVATGASTDVVHGVLFDIPDIARRDLDRSEGGYDPVLVAIQTDGGEVQAITYIARRDRTSDTVRPYTWYKAFIVEGAEQHSLPAEYIAKLAGIEAVKDPNVKREAGERALLRSV